MTVPNTQDMQNQFESDNQKLLDAAAQYRAAWDEEQAAANTYKANILKKLDSLQDADQILVYLQMYVFQNSGMPSYDPANPTATSSDSCLFGIYGDQLSTQGQALDVNGYLTAVHNDIQKMVNSNSTDPEVVHNVATDLDTMLNELKNNPDLKGDPQPANPDPKTPPVYPGAVDQSTLSNIISADTAMRSDIYDATDTGSGYNPTPADPSDPNKPGSTYHFTYGVTPQGGGSANYITNFAVMQQWMQDPNHSTFATEGYKNFTDNLNSDAGTTQTVNASLNESINQLTNFIKQLTQFYQNALLAPPMKTIDSAIQNQTRAG